MYPMNKQNLHSKAWVQCLLSADLQAWKYYRWLGPSSLTFRMPSANGPFSRHARLPSSLSISWSNVLKLSLIYDLHLLTNEFRSVNARQKGPFPWRRLHCILWQRIGAKFRCDWKRFWGLSRLQRDQPVYVLRHVHICDLPRLRISI